MRLKQFCKFNLYLATPRCSHFLAASDRLQNISTSRHVYLDFKHHRVVTVNFEFSGQAFTRYLFSSLDAKKFFLVLMAPLSVLVSDTFQLLLDNSTVGNTDLPHIYWFEWSLVCSKFGRFCSWNFDNWLHYMVAVKLCVISRLVCCTWSALLVLYYIKIS